MKYGAEGWPQLVQYPYKKELFGGSGTLVWTVDTADYYGTGSGGLWYAILGSMMLVSLVLENTSLSGSGSGLICKLPEGRKMPHQLIAVFGSVYHTNGGGAWALGQVWTGLTQHPDNNRCLRFSLANAANWSSATNNLNIRAAALISLE